MSVTKRHSLFLNMPCTKHDCSEVCHRRHSLVRKYISTNRELKKRIPEMEMTNCGSPSVWQIEKAHGRAFAKADALRFRAAKVERADSGPMRRSR